MVVRRPRPMPAPRAWRASTSAVVAATLLAAGVTLRRARRYDDRHRRAIAALDVERDHEEIVRRLGSLEFAWDTETALSLALFRTFAVPSISRILASTGEFTQRPRKRYDDTELLLAEIGEHGYDHARGREALRRINRMHAAYPIRSEDLTYVLSTFALEPDRFNARFGWRRSTEHERAATWRYWRELGARMGVRDLPPTLGDLDTWNRRYEAAEFAFDPANRAVADATLRMYLRDVYGLPGWALPAGRLVACSLLDQPVLDALGYDVPPRVVRATVHLVLRVRAAGLRWLVAPRRRPVRLTERSRTTYPCGYRVEELGTFPGGGPPACPHAAEPVHPQDGARAGADAPREAGSRGERALP
jgi:hypothetical protein